MTCLTLMATRWRWRTPERFQALDTLKQLPTSSPCLGLPAHLIYRFEEGKKTCFYVICPYTGSQWEASACCILVPHTVHALISQARTAHLTPSKAAPWYHNVLLTMSRVTLQRSTILNPATLYQLTMMSSPMIVLSLVDQVCKATPWFIWRAF